MATQRAVFLDRDGVLNRSIVRDGKPYAPRTLADFELLPGVPEAVERLRSAGYLTIVVTNQPDLGRGLVPADVVESMHDRLRTELRVDDVRVCPHGDEHDCGCRKPLPGMLTEAARDHSVDLGSSWMVGDRWRDVDAGRAAGCRTILVESGHSESTPTSPDFAVPSLLEASDVVLQSPVTPSLQESVR